MGNKRAYNSIITGLKEALDDATGTCQIRNCPHSSLKEDDDMESTSIEKPIKYDYSVSDDDMVRFRRKRQRAKELGIELFVLDSEEYPKELKELKELENYIIDNYLELDLDVPDDIKKKYLELKERLHSIDETAE